jgi:drug/metabolite transporter (DMT)-like permease
MSSPGSRWLPGFVLLSAVWGASFALIKIAVDAGVPPPWVAFWRCLLGALALWMVVAATRATVPLGRRDKGAGRVWGHAAVAAALLNTVPFILLAYGETRVTSVEAGILNAATPLFTVVFAILLIPSERPGPWRLTGLALGVVGVCFVLGIGQVNIGTSVVGGLSCVGATACYGAGFTYTRRYLTGLPYQAASLAALQVSCAAVELAVVAPLIGGAPAWPSGGGRHVAAVVGALLALGVLGTGLAYLVNTSLVRTAGPTVASTVTYAIPVWSTGIGVVALGEGVGWGTVVGGVLVVVAIGVTRVSRSGTRPSSPCPRAPDCGSAAGSGRGSR